MTQSEEFFAAVRRGDLAAVREWLARDGALVNARARNGFTPMTTALLLGWDDVANEILSHRPALTVHEASILGDLDRVKALVEGDPRLANDASAPDGLAPLALAAQLGRTDVVAYLLSKGAEVNHAAPGGETALTGAVVGGHAAVVRLLLGAGADANHRYERRGFSPLITAAAAGDLAIVKLLVEAGADLRARTTDGRTALSTAVEWGHADVEEYLSGLGAP